MGERLLTVSQMAERLSVSGETIYRMFRERRLAYLRPTGARGAYRIREAEFERFVKASEVLPVGVRRGEVA